MQLNLKSHAGNESLAIQWNQDAGTFSGDKAVVLEIEAACRLGLKNGSLPTPVVNLDYAIKNPFHEANELAVVLSCLDYYCDELPLPIFAEAAELPEGAVY